MSSPENRPHGDSGRLGAGCSESEAVRPPVTHELDPRRGRSTPGFALSREELDIAAVEDRAGRVGGEARHSTGQLPGLSVVNLTDGEERPGGPLRRPRSHGGFSLDDLRTVSATGHGRIRPRKRHGVPMRTPALWTCAPAIRRKLLHPRVLRLAVLAAGAVALARAGLGVTPLAEGSVRVRAQVCFHTPAPVPLGSLPNQRSVPEGRSEAPDWGRSIHSAAAGSSGWPITPRAHPSPGVATPHDSPPFRAFSASAALDAVGYRAERESAADAKE